jgi:hypothetical protein
LPQCGKMAEFDLAIAGTGLLPGLLAGALARDHGRKVVRIGRPMSPQRLPRGLNLALPLATRPESWRMLRRAEAETSTLLGSMGVAGGLARVEAQIVSDLAPTAAALDHLAHMALGHEHQVRRVPGGWSFRHVTMLDREAIELRLGEWLKAAGVATIDEGSVDAALTVLASDDAVLEGLDEDKRPAPLLSQAMTSTLLVSRAPAAPIRRFADRGVTLLDRPGNTVLAIVAGEQDVDARLASTLPGPFPVKRLATTRYRRVVMADGAPLIGKVGKPFVIAGLGDTAAFFAPSLARLLAGVAKDDEKPWFGAHDPASNRRAVSDFAAAAEVTA